jgi:2-iminobutanoate/2-iminopropanoate deaminase
MTRRSINVDGQSHGATAIPTASLVGPLLISGSISGVDRATGTVPDDIATEVRNVFANVQAVVEAAGGTLDDIAKLTFLVPDRSLRAEIDPVWTETFPDPASRPARHASVYDHLPNGLHLQCELIAYIGGN